MRRRPRTGSEPVTARTATGARTWLASFGVLACAAAAVVLGTLALDRTGSDRALLTVLVLLALVGVLAGIVDLAVLGRRRRQRASR